MKAIVFAQASQLEVVNKFWRPFYKERSLADVQVEKLLRSGFKRNQIHVVSDDARCLMGIRQRYAVETINQPPAINDGKSSPCEYFERIAKKIQIRSDVALCSCSSPTFNEYRLCLDKWRQRPRHIDSLAVAFPVADRLMIGEDHLSPFGWSVGSHHLAPMAKNVFSMPLCFSIIDRKSFIDQRYFWTTDAMWHISEHPHIRIRTIRDFKDARAVFAARAAEDKESGLVRGKVQKV